MFCGFVDPDPEHIKKHGYTACVGRDSAERTFYRKDHLRQHLRLMHGNCLFVPSMDSWKSVTNMIRSRCGFCDAVFNTWDDRVDHLAEHFSEGASLSEWVGDWGFDDEVLEILERASLPGESQEGNRDRYLADSKSADDCDYGLVLDLERYFPIIHISEFSANIAIPKAPNSVPRYLPIISILKLIPLIKVWSGTVRWILQQMSAFLRLLTRSP